MTEKIQKKKIEQVSKKGRERLDTIASLNKEVPALKK